jgi:hypothetical protein
MGATTAPASASRTIVIFSTCIVPVVLAMLVLVLILAPVVDARIPVVAADLDPVVATCAPVVARTPVVSEMIECEPTKSVIY